MAGGAESKRLNVTTRSATFRLTANYEIIMGNALNSGIVKYPLAQMILQLE